MPTIQPLKGNPPATSIRIVRAVVSRRRKLPAMFNPRGGRRFAAPVATPARREPAARAKNFGIFRSQERLYLRLATTVVYPRGRAAYRVPLDHCALEILAGNIAPRSRRCRACADRMAPR